MVKFGIEFVPDMNIEKIINYAKLAEELGYTNTWITDHHVNRSVYTTLTAIALNTKNIILGPGVTNPYTRNVVITASAIQSLREIAPGRTCLGIGAGDKATLDTLGISRDKPLTMMRDAVNAIRSLLTESKVKEAGELINLKGNKIFKLKEVEDHVPIYVGAQGPKMLELASELADGILINASHPKDFEFAIKQIKQGAEKANRNLDDIDVTAYTSFSIAEDVQKARDAAKIVVAFIVCGSPKQILERHNIDLESAENIGACIGRGKFQDAMSSVTDDMLDAFSISGTKKECLDRIEELNKAGVTQIVTGSPIGPKLEESIKIIGKEIISNFK